MFDLFGIKARKLNAYLMSEIICYKEAMSEARNALVLCENTLRQARQDLYKTDLLIAENERLREEKCRTYFKINVI